jgi:hypothetical protein
VSRGEEPLQGSLFCASTNAIGKVFHYEVLGNAQSFEKNFISRCVKKDELYHSKTPFGWPVVKRLSTAYLETVRI